MARYGKTHGMSQGHFYLTYRGLLGRCKYKNPDNGKYYKTKGIKCLWHSFEEFKDDMYADYQVHFNKHGRKNTQIDRIDPNGHYCKENCRWVTISEQNRNRSNNTFLSYNGKTQNLVDWAKELEINKDTLSTRIMRGWTTERLLTTPARKYTEFRI